MNYEGRQGRTSFFEKNGAPPGEAIKLLLAFGRGGTAGGSTPPEGEKKFFGSFF
jgi:hypothetical protein